MGIKILIHEYHNILQQAKKKFEQVKTEPSNSVKSFLSKLAKQRNISLGQDASGDITLFRIEKTVESKFTLVEGVDGVGSVTVGASGQRFHSEITAIRQASTITNNAGQSTVKSPFVSGVDRPKVVTLSNGSTQDTKEYATQVACAEAKDIDITIPLLDWKVKGVLPRLGDLFELETPLLKGRTELIIHAITLNKSKNKGETMTINAVPPCVYTGILPTESPF